MRTLSRRESRLVALLLLVAAIALVQTVIVGPIVSGFSERAQAREDLASRFAFNNRVIASIPRLRRRAEAHVRAMQDYILATPDAGSAAEQLRQRIQSSVLAVGGEFRSGEDIDAPARSIGTRVTARLSWPQCLSLLTRLQNERPYLTVTSLAIGAEDALVTGQSGTLDVQIEATIPYSPAAAR